MNTDQARRIGAAVNVWGATEDGDDEADIALDKVLVAEGVYAAGEPVYFESDHPGLVHIFLGDRIIQIDEFGRIEEF